MISYGETACSGSGGRNSLPRHRIGGLGQPDRGLERDEAGQGLNPLQPLTDGGIGREIDISFGRASYVGIERDVSDRGAAGQRNPLAGRQFAFDNTQHVMGTGDNSVSVEACAEQRDQPRRGRSEGDLPRCNRQPALDLSGLSASREASRSGQTFARYTRMALESANTSSSMRTGTCPNR